MVLRYANKYFLNFKQVLPKHVKSLEKGQFFQTEKKHEIKWKLRLQYEIRSLTGRKQILFDHSSGIVDPFYGNQYIFFIHTKCFNTTKKSFKMVYALDALRNNLFVQST